MHELFCEYIHMLHIFVSNMKTRTTILFKLNWEKKKKSSKVRQEWKTLISVFERLFERQCKKLSPAGEGLRSVTINHSATRDAFYIQSFLFWISSSVLIVVNGTYTKTSLDSKILWTRLQLKVWSCRVFA